MKCLLMYEAGRAKGNTPCLSLGCLGSGTCGAGGHGRRGRTWERPVKGFIGVVGVLKCVFVLRATVVGGVRLTRPLLPLSPAKRRRIFQTDTLGSTTTVPLLRGGCQLSFSRFRARGLLGDLWASMTAGGRWAWASG